MQEHLDTFSVSLEVPDAFGDHFAFQFKTEAWMWDSIESIPDRSLIQQTDRAVRTHQAIFGGLGPGSLA